MAQITNFFAGANSGEGFRNLFSEMVDIENTYDFMVLKGGPGVGKNTFMREIGRTMEAAGTPVEYLWFCRSSDARWRMVHRPTALYQKDAFAAARSRGGAYRLS